ncbi:MAG: phosphoribosylamine--glycine ligase [Chloroflexi bacterium]|nr:phosphoribosylamine--glycine ligase [Chloroflexota bacterium]
MKILVVGSGAREHAIAWKLAQSDRVDAVCTAPGNAGTAELGDNLPVDVGDFGGLAEAVVTNRVDLVVVGPEIPLAAGIVDFLQARDVPVFGPNRRAAAIEGSKAFAKDLMQKHRIPCAWSETFDSFEEACACIHRLPEPPVVKVDGLAAGKGVTVAESKDEALAAVEAAMVRRVFGDAGRRVVLEERLRGIEASVFAFTDGKTVLTTIPACDYKRAWDGDRGPNTGGMGSYSPPEFFHEGLVRRINETVLEPTVKAMAAEGTPYKGILYAGLMVDEGSTKVLEFNCRLGDPETQVILPRMTSDLLDVIEATIDNRLDQASIQWDQRPCVGVVIASGGYPGEYRKGHPISGLSDVDPDVAVFHAGTRRADGRVVTDGGRVLTVTALGDTMEEARARAYDNVRRIQFQDARWRTDIALRAVVSESPAC